MIDLHSHTWLSDGDLAPEELCARALALGIRQLAITDHDTTGAHHQLRQFSDVNLQIIPGVEISTNWEGREVHVVGLLLDIDNPALKTLLLHQQSLRKTRAENIANQMQRADRKSVV